MNLFRNIKQQLVPTKNSMNNLSFSGKTNSPYSTIIYPYEQSNFEYSQIIKEIKPALIGRIGASELKSLNNYIVKHLVADNEIEIRPEIITELYTHSGVFPPSLEIFNLFCQVYIDAIKCLDFVGIWNNVGEPFLLNMLCPQAKLSELQNIEPFFSDNPWTSELEKKKVLIIHPFTNSIQEQYMRREYLFKNKQMLPEFELITLKAVQSLSGDDRRFENWIEALNYMKNQISEIDFDVAIIGAGAYGLPLGAYIKSIGKIAFHLGGVTQILFGIKGKRWESRPEYQKLFNEYWVYPSEKEIPEKGNLADGNGPYWK